MLLRYLRPRPFSANRHQISNLTDELRFLFFGKTISYNNDWPAILNLVANMDDSNSMLAFVLDHLPDYWDPVPSYICSNMLISLSPSRNADEYYFVESMFYGAHVSRISRVQNPFTYGRFMLRREMIQSTYEVSTWLIPIYLLVVFILLCVLYTVALCYVHTTHLV